MGEPINTQPIAPKEKEANLLSSAVPDSLGTEREGGRRGRERGERGRERGRRGREGKRERERESTISAQSAAVSFCFFILTANKKTMPTVFLHTKLAIN